MLKTPLTRKYQESGYARLEIPEAEDLLIRRLQEKSQKQNDHSCAPLHIFSFIGFLDSDFKGAFQLFDFQFWLFGQGELSKRVEDNWRSINDPQRWQILQGKGASHQILKSFKDLRQAMEELETDINIPAVEKALNNIKLDPEDTQTWINVWDDLRRKVGTIAQLYNYFKGYIDNSDATEDSTLQDFSSSIAMSSVKERSMKNMLDSFHQAVTPEDSQKRQLFPYFQTILSKVVQSFQPWHPHFGQNVYQDDTCF